MMVPGMTSSGKRLGRPPLRGLSHVCGPACSFPCPELSASEDRQRELEKYPWLILPDSQHAVAQELVECDREWRPLVERARQLGARRGELVRAAWDAGVSWGQLGLLLGVDRQTVAKFRSKTEREA